MRKYISLIICTAFSIASISCANDRIPIGGCYPSSTPITDLSPATGIEITSEDELPLLIKALVHWCQYPEVNLVFDDLPAGATLDEVTTSVVADCSPQKPIAGSNQRVKNGNFRRFLAVPPHHYCWESSGFANGQWKWHVEATDPDEGQTVVSETRLFTVDFPRKCESAHGKIGPSLCNKCLDGCAGISNCCMGTGCLCQDACSYANQNLDCSMYGDDWHAEVETDSYVSPVGEYSQWIVARGCCHNDCTGIQQSFDDDVRDLCTGCSQCHTAVEVTEEATDIPGGGGQSDGGDVNVESGGHGDSSFLTVVSVGLLLFTLLFDTAVH